MSKGLFIAFDGPNGSGKTTLITLLCQKLQNRNFDVVITKHFKDSPFSGLLNTDYEKSFKKEARACLFAADRYWRIHNIIEPNLEDGKVLICDRFIASSYVYQVLDGCSYDFIREINAKARKPDIYFFISTFPQLISERISKRDATDVFENDHHRQQEINLFLETAQQMKKLGIHTLTIENNTTVEYAINQILEQINIMIEGSKDKIYL